MLEGVPTIDFKGHLHNALKSFETSKAATADDAGEEEMGNAGQQPVEK